MLNDENNSLWVWISFDIKDYSYIFLFNYIVRILILWKNEYLFRYVNLVVC